MNSAPVSLVTSFVVDLVIDVYALKQNLGAGVKAVFVFREGSCAPGHQSPQ